MTDDPTTTDTGADTPDAEDQPTRTRTRPRRTTRKPPPKAEAVADAAGPDGGAPLADSGEVPVDPVAAADDAQGPAGVAAEERPEPADVVVAPPAPKRRRRAATPRTTRSRKAAAVPVPEPSASEDDVAETAAPDTAAMDQPAADEIAAAAPAPDEAAAEAPPGPGPTRDGSAAEDTAAEDTVVVGAGDIAQGEMSADTVGVETPGSVDEPEVEVAAEEVAPVVRRRRRRRTVADEPPATTEPLPDAEATLVADAGGQVVAGEEPAAEDPTAGEEPAAEDPTAGEEPAAEDPTAGEPVVAAGEAVATPAEEGTDGGALDGDDEGDGDGETADDGRPKSSRRRRRGGRGRGRRGRGAAEGDGDAVPTADDAPAAITGPAQADGDAPAADDAPAAGEVDGDDGGDGAPPTRLSARNRRSGGRGRAGATARGRGRSGRVLGGVSEEIRRAIAEGPPRKMLVTVGEQRTQIVVMEERNLVEHYVTRRQDVSYVGNVYVGRIQNVLPGMEAAFVDIGKGRNGVLYAGEVNYDEADLDGDLPRIEQTLKPGQTVLVQVTKDPMGTKGARLTQQLSIAGRYCVLAPGDGMLGISRKLADDERERLRKVLKSIKPERYGLIVRTAAEGATKEQLEADVARLVRIWEQVESRAATAGPLEPVYEEPDLVIRVIRDVFGPEFTDLIVDDEVLADQVRGYLDDVSPELVDKVSVQRAEEPLFDGYEVTNQIRRALEKKVWLKSGGYLIVEKTEAMWVIDVNTGKFVGKSNLEETVLRNNIEAAQEIARQLRLRDMGGIIVIDFVDMLVPANRDEVLKRFKRELARDKTKSRVMEISRLGLVQMTRKNVSQGLNDSFTTVCDCCEGRGAQMVPSILG